VGRAARAWKDATPEQAWRRLQQVSAGNTDEETLRGNLRAHARALVDAPPADVVARLGDFLDDHLAAELTADEVWGYLREKCGFRPTD
jgi:ABC-type nitrate/sulfonate/bicarbonate transport system substrate-binding protein